MTLSTETVKVAKDILYGGFNGKVLPFKDCFEVSDTVTAKHILDGHYRGKLGHQIPKIFIYIAMDETFGPCTGKDEKGFAGYHLKVKENIFIV